MGQGEKNQMASNTCLALSSTARVVVREGAGNASFLSIMFFSLYFTEESGENNEHLVSSGKWVQAQP